MTDIATVVIPPHLIDRIIVGAPDECWPWSGYTDHDGYGINNSKRVHREVLISATGVAGPQAMHSCDFPPCCNPRHLRWGTASDNQQDSVAKGRARTGREAWTECKNGHPFDEQNTRVTPAGRRCRACEYNRCRAYRAARKAQIV